MKRLASLALAAGVAFGLTGCSDDDVDLVSENLSTAADNFEIGELLDALEKAGAGRG